MCLTFGVFYGIIEYNPKERNKMTNYNETIGDLNLVDVKHPVLLKLQERISELEMTITGQSAIVADYKKGLEQLRERTNKHQKNCQSLLETLLDDEEITFDVATLIANCFDNVSLTKTIEVEFQITAIATMEIPFGSDVDDIANSVYVSGLDFYTDLPDVNIDSQGFDVLDFRVVS